MYYLRHQQTYMTNQKGNNVHTAVSLPLTGTTDSYPNQSIDPQILFAVMFPLNQCKTYENLSDFSYERSD